VCNEHDYIDEVIGGDRAVGNPVEMIGPDGFLRKVDVR
jgi:hypothetical protein